MKSLTAIALLAAAFAAAPLRAQSIDPAVRGATDALTADQRQQLSAYLSAQAEKFGSADPSQVVAVRNELCKVLRDAKTKDGFRREFGAEFVRQFGKFATGSDLLRATNVFIVARHAPCGETVGYLVDTMDPARNRDAALRVAAAEQLRRTVQPGSLPGTLAVTVAKRAAGFLSTEDQWVAASREVGVIVDAIKTKALTAEQVDSIASSLSAAVNVLASRAFEPGKSDLGFALQRALLAVRSDLPDLPTTTQSRFYEAIAPSVTKLAALRDKQVDGYGSAEKKDALQSITVTAELLTRIRSGKPR